MRFELCMCVFTFFHLFLQESSSLYLFHLFLSPKLISHRWRPVLSAQFSATQIWAPIKRLLPSHPVRKIFEIRFQKFSFKFLLKPIGSKLVLNPIQWIGSEWVPNGFCSICFQFVCSFKLQFSSLYSATSNPRHHSSCLSLCSSLCSSCLQKAHFGELNFAVSNGG